MSTKDVIQALGERNQKVAVAESITGGAVLRWHCELPNGEQN
jgi:nicotinamide mononucleotide (NMN) deamidase PncC